jgi:hypothetical protein
MVKARDGVTWAEEFARLPALKAVVRDDGTGLGKGVRLERARRRVADLPDLSFLSSGGPSLGAESLSRISIFEPRGSGQMSCM